MIEALSCEAPRSLGALCKRALRHSSAIAAGNTGDCSTSDDIFSDAVLDRKQQEPSRLLQSTAVGQCCIVTMATMLGLAHRCLAKKPRYTIHWVASQRLLFMLLHFVPAELLCVLRAAAEALLVISHHPDGKTQLRQADCIPGDLQQSRMFTFGLHSDSAASFCRVLPFCECWLLVVLLKRLSHY